MSMFAFSTAPFVDLVNFFPKSVIVSSPPLIISLQLLAVFMQMGARELLMHYMDLKQTNDVQLTFEALKV